MLNNYIFKIKKDSKYILKYLIILILFLKCFFYKYFLY